MHVLKAVMFLSVLEISLCLCVWCMCGVCVCDVVCVVCVSRWRQDHVVAEGDHGNFLFAQKWYVLLCWNEFLTTKTLEV